MGNMACDKIIITLSADQRVVFTKGFKMGILKQLHKNKLLTDKQLNQLIEMQK